MGTRGTRARKMDLVTRILKKIVVPGLSAGLSPGRPERTFRSPGLARKCWSDGPPPSQIAAPPRRGRECSNSPGFPATSLRVAPAREAPDLGRMWPDPGPPRGIEIVIRGFRMGPARRFVRQFSPLGTDLSVCKTVFGILTDGERRMGIRTTPGSPGFTSFGYPLS